MQLNSSNIRGFYMKIRYYSIYSKFSYNVCIYKEAGKLSNLFIFNLVIVIF